MTKLWWDPDLRAHQQHMLRQKRDKSALLEKEENVAHTVRTSGVTWIDYAREFGIPEDCYNPIKTYNFCSPNNKVSISGDKAKAAVLDVRKTYRFLAEQAKNKAQKFLSTQT
ncbi:MAG: hypothetical protein CM1200mP23_3440 [Nitrososphaerota archaeon]|nr:MAG: hypothetical protein CM1200mP23_3440 [Nitrososphaerota archaeon]